MSGDDRLRRAWSVAVYPRHRGRVLLIRHRRLGVWLPPGGECQPGETPLEAAARELVEETGLVGRFPVTSAVDGTPPGLIGYEEHVAGAKGQHLNFVFVVDVDTDEVRPNHEFGEWRWVTDAGGLDAPPNVGQLAAVALATPLPSLRAIGERWLDAFNRADLEALLALYAEDATHTTPQSPRPLVGKAALRAWWGGAFARLPGLRYHARAVGADGERVWIEYQRLAPGAAPVEVAVVLQLAAGAIHGSRVFHGAENSD